MRASTLAPKARARRAPFTCLGCGEGLILHYGRIRAPHFAHRPGSVCPLTAPETALHFDTKERILALCEDAFAGKRQVQALRRCPSCRQVVPLDLGALGDRSKSEGAIGNLRIDVLVSRGSHPVLAIEVRVTHAIEAEKEASLRDAQVPALEVDAREEWERLVAGGVDIVCARSIGFPPCPACEASAWAEREVLKGGEATEIAELEGYRSRGLLKLTSWPGAPGADPSAPVTIAELAELEARFTCPDCGSRTLEPGMRIVRHTCEFSGEASGARSAGRPVGWRGYNGSLITLGWWQRRPGASSGRESPKRNGS